MSTLGSSSSSSKARDVGVFIMKKRSDRGSSMKVPDAVGDKDKMKGRGCENPIDVVNE